MRKFIVISIFFVSSLVNAQDIQLKNNQGGLLSLGVRSTISAFNDSKTNNFGKGIGGQFRMQLSERVNTDWFFDYLTSDIGSVAHRSDYHIGWSVLFYPYLKDSTTANAIVGSRTWLLQNNWMPGIGCAMKSPYNGWY